MHPLSKAFVFTVFLVLGASFWATTAMLYIEFAADWRQPRFEGAVWFDLMTHHSHVFLFFPLFGTVALIAFFLPASVFVDMYWARPKNDLDPIPFGRTRFTLWFLAIAGLAGVLTWALNLGGEAALWQIKRDKLVETNTPTPTCARQRTDGTCARVTFQTALANIRRVSQDRERLTDLRRECTKDPLIETIDSPERRRYCFVTAPYTHDAATLQSRLIGDEACCNAMRRFKQAAGQAYVAGQDDRSLLDRTQIFTLFFKIFFLLVILVISILLAFRRDRIKRLYGALGHRIDRGVLIGALAMFLLPIMNHAYLLGTELLYGANDVLGNADDVSYYRIPYVLSMAFVGWGFIIMLSFIRSGDKDADQLAKILGTLASGVFVLNYDTVIDYAVRLAGPGAGNQAVGAMVGLAVALWVVLAALYLADRTSNRRAVKPGHSPARPTSDPNEGGAPS